MQTNDDNKAAPSVECRALFAFWGGPWNGRTENVPVDAQEWRVHDTDYSSRTLAGFSAALDYIGGYSMAEFPATVIEYRKSHGEFVEAKLLRHLMPRNIADVLRYLASRPLRCHRCDELQKANAQDQTREPKISI